MNKNIAHVWTPASLGGGGYITGLIQHPAISGIVYARCDVAVFSAALMAGRHGKR